MGNYNNDLNQIHFILNTDTRENLKEGLYNIFRHDCDFTENEEYFREDTISLGYKDEAERIIFEYVNHHDKKKYRLKEKEDFENLINQLCLEIFSNDTYYKDFGYNVIQIDDTKFSVAISYVS